MGCITMADSVFSIIYDGKHGKSVQSGNPRIDAYRQVAHISKNMGLNYSLTAHEDGCYTVAGDGLMPITFEPEGQAE